MKIPKFYCLIVSLLLSEVKIKITKVEARYLDCWVRPKGRDCTEDKCFMASQNCPSEPDEVITASCEIVAGGGPFCYCRFRERTTSTNLTTAKTIYVPNPTNP